MKLRLYEDGAASADHGLRHGATVRFEILKRTTALQESLFRLGADDGRRPVCLRRIRWF